MVDLVCLILTLGMYLLARKINQQFNEHPLFSTAFMSIMGVAAILFVSHMPHQEYFAGAKPIHFMLGPATVALALPIVHQFEHMKKFFMSLSISLLLGSLIGIFSAVLIGWAFALPKDVLIALSPKSVTSSIAMAIAEKIGGPASLATVFVMLTGLVGAAIATPLLNLVRIDNHMVRGFAMGLASHGLGTARAFQSSEVAGAFAGLAMALNGIVTATILPLLIFILGLL